MKRVQILLLFVLLSLYSYSQCFMNILQPTQDTTICLGDSIQFSAYGSCTFLMNNDFDLGTVGTGWSSNASPMFNNPCPPTVLPATGVVCWVGSATNFPRELVTVNYDMSLGGCSIEFDMKYGEQQTSTNCEDPDAANEGIHLQYSTNNGVLWTDIYYWTPTSSMSGPLYIWNHYNLSVPVAASTNNSKFRWFQDLTSGNTWDHWGIDNVEIQCPNNQNIFWNYGATDLNPPPIAPTSSYNYQVFVVDSFGNTAWDNLYVTVVPNPEPDLGPDTVVCSFPGNTGLFEVDPDSLYDTYLWNTGQTSSIITPDSSGLYIVTVTIGNCSGVDSIYLTMSPAPVADAGPDIDICLNDTITLNPSPLPGATFIWNPGDTIQNLTVGPIVTTDYLLTVSMGANCEDYDTVIVNVNPLPLADAGLDTAICIGDNVTISASGGNSYVWSTGDLIPTVTMSPIATDIYSVTVTDANGCVYFDSLEVVVNPLPVVTIYSSDSAVCIGEKSILTANGGIDYIWNTGDVGSVIEVSPRGSKTYRVDITDINTCKNSNSIVVAGIDCSTFFIGNTFTPNGDGYNDYFKPIGDLEPISDYNMFVYNQWGSMIFNTVNKYDNGWDGKFKFESVPKGVYVYHVKYRNGLGEPVERKGTVILLR